MIRLLTKLILIEVAAILALSFKTHLRLPAAVVFGRATDGRGPLIVKTIQCTFLAFLVSTLYNVLKIRRRCILAGLDNPTDQLLFMNKLLEASLTGILLFLSVVLDRLHQLITEGVSLKKSMKAEEKQLKERKLILAQHLIVLQEEVNKLKAKNKMLEMECQTKTDKAEAAKAVVLALKKKSEEFQTEYDQLLEYNQILRNQLHSIDQGLLEDSQETGWINLKASVLSWGSIKTPNKISEELGPQNEVITSNGCDQFLCSSSLEKSSPRHRRPIYQH